MLGLELTEWTHQRQRQVEAKVMDREECQAVYRTDGARATCPDWDSRHRTGRSQGLVSNMTARIIPTRLHYLKEDQMSMATNLLSVFAYYYIELSCPFFIHEPSIMAQIKVIPLPGQSR